MSKFNIGQKIRAVRDTDVFRKGDLGTVAGIFWDADEKQWNYLCDVPWSSTDWYIWERDAESADTIQHQYAVFYPKRDNEIHRGPFETREEAQKWIDDAVADGFKSGIFVVREREVGEWK